MEYRLKNEQLDVLLSTLGAELQSIRKDKVEYLWQGNSEYWEERAPILFPFVGRLTDGKYLLNDKEYEMTIHGFARFQEYQVVEQSDTHIVFEMKDNEVTYVSYPYHFALRITYELEGNVIKIKYTVKNDSNQEMYFGIGGHPGFCVPLEDELQFSDYELQFSQPCIPDRVGYTDTCYVSGINTLFELQDTVCIPLEHCMFNDDAIVLQNMAKEVCLYSKKGTRSVTVSYPQCSYVGFWHAPKTEAPYLCIEPWSSVAARQGIVEKLDLKNDLIRLDVNKTYENNWSIKID